MPIKSATIDLANVSEEDTKSETELRKQAFSQILKDARLVGITNRICVCIWFGFDITGCEPNMNLEQWSQDRFATLALLRTVFGFVKVIIAAVIAVELLT